MLTVYFLIVALVFKKLLIFFFSYPDYPHKYGKEGGCADHTVFGRMKKYQASAVEEPTQVSANSPDITN